MVNQRRVDIISALICMGVGIAFLIGSFKYGNLQNIPNPGLFPFLGSSCFVLFSFILLVTAVMNREQGSEKSFFREKSGAKKVVWVIASLIGYLLTLEYLGFPLAIFLFMIFSLRFLMRKKWRTTLIFAFLAMLFSYILFILLLGVQLPRGVL